MTPATNLSLFVSLTTQTTTLWTSSQRLGRLRRYCSPIYDVKEERQDKHVMSIRENGLDYSRGVLIMTLRSDVGSSYTSLDEIMSAMEGSNVLKPDVLVALVNGHHCFVALEELPTGDEYLQWEGAGLKMSLITLKAGKLMTSHEIILYGCSYKNLARLVLLDDRFLNTSKNIMMFS